MRPDVAWPTASAPTPNTLLKVTARRPATTGYKALTLAPAPALQRRRAWAKAGAVLGVAHIVLVVTVILLNLDRLAKVVEVLGAMSDIK